jgi:deoxyribose-phosphate aldolase
MSLPPTQCEQTENDTAENQRLAQHIDHTKLTFGANEDENQAIRQLCQEAKTNGFFAVCVRPRHIALAKGTLQGVPVKVATVIGFPLDKVELQQELAHSTVGQFSTDEKVFETQQSVQAGADELDLVMNVNQLKQDLKTGSQSVRAEFQAIQEAAQGTPIKVIIEIDLLSEAEILLVTELCAQTGMAMVKTSTGMVNGGKGATLEAVRLIADRLKALNSPAGIKASGGIKTRSQALAFLNLGVQRLGTSSGVAILQGETVAPEAY